MTDAELDIIEQEAEGPEVIRNFVRHLPRKSGVYRMIDAKGDVIYAGKARDLKARVGNYTRIGGHTNRIATMIALTRHMEFVTTETVNLLLFIFCAKY